MHHSLAAPHHPHTQLLRPQEGSSLGSHLEGQARAGEPAQALAHCHGPEAPILLLGNEQVRATEVGGLIKN